MMLVDGLIVYGLHIWEGRLKKKRAEIAEKDALVHEIEKKAASSEKAALREKNKAEQKKLKQHAKMATNAPKAPIQQPDRNKKMR